MDDMRLSLSFARHPKTVKLLRRLHEPGAWAFLCLLLWVAENRPDGNLEGLAGEDVEIAAGWTGEAGKLVDALCEVKYLDGSDGSYRVHDWGIHQPWVLNRARRVEAARAAARVRWDATAHSEPDAGPMRTGCESHAEGNADAMLSTNTQPIPNQEPTPRVSRPQGKPSDAAVRLAAFLKAEIQKNAPTFKFSMAQERNWVTTADRMLRLDGRTEAEAVAVIRFAQGDEFWRSNVLSMETVRAKFDQLRMKSTQRPGRATTAPEYLREGGQRAQSII